jgi:hypothetical protein
MLILGEEPELNRLRSLMILTALVALMPAALILTGCKSLNQIQVSLNTQFTLPVGQTAVLKDTGISFKFDAVTGDSRCPSGVQCIQAGNATSRLLVTQKGQTQELILNQLGSTDNNVQDFIGGYKVAFQLSPYPQAGSQINPKDYVLTMRIY